MTDSSCLRCGSSESQPFIQGTDRLYRVTDERFWIVRCLRCGMARLSPRPDERDLGRYYPDAYWFDPGENAASRLAEKYRRLVVGDHLRFVMRAWRDAGARGQIGRASCGGGLIGGLLRAKGVQAIGFDLSRQAC